MKDNWFCGVDHGYNYKTVIVMGHYDKKGNLVINEEVFREPKTTKENKKNVQNHEKRVSIRSKKVKGNRHKKRKV